MSLFPELDEVVTAIAEHGEYDVATADYAISPDQTVPDTRITAVVPGFPLTSTPGEETPYTHCIHRYAVIGGDDITWVAPNGVLGSTTRGPFGENTADDDVVDSVWQAILQQLAIDKDPHQR